MFRENHCQLRILYLAKRSHLSEDKIKTFQTNKELTTQKPLWKKMKTTYHSERREFNPERRNMQEVTTLGLPQYMSLAVWIDEDMAAHFRWSLGPPLLIGPLVYTEASCQLLFITLSQPIITSLALQARAVANNKELV